MEKEYLKKIYDLAKESYDNDEIPVGAIIVRNGEIIASGVNNREKNKSVIGHAEISAIEAACKVVGDWRLDDWVMYVTLLPCMMCAGTIIESRIDKIFYLCDRTNVCFESKIYINVVKINDNSLEKKCLNLLQLFFENKRN